jgi:tetratricopeptide (TPR) repeat protein
MRPRIHFVPEAPFCSTLFAILLAISLPSLAPGQAVDSNSSEPARAAIKLAVGSEVVFKTSQGPVSGKGRKAYAKLRPPLVIDRVETDRVSIRSRFKKRQLWVRQDQVVPFEQAIDDLDTEIKKKPRDVELYARMAQLWADHGDDDRARANLDEAIRLDPKQPWLYVRRSSIFIQKQQLDRALADCDKAIELAPNDEQAYLNRAAVWTASGDYQRAGADLEEAVRLDPANPYAWGERSRYWLQMKKADKALDDINEAIRLAPDDATLLCWRGNAWAARSEEDKAIADYAEGIRLDPEHVAGFEGRAKA